MTNLELALFLITSTPDEWNAWMAEQIGVSTEDLHVYSAVDGLPIGGRLKLKLDAKAIRKLDSKKGDSLLARQSHVARLVADGIALNGKILVGIDMAESSLRYALLRGCTFYHCNLSSVGFGNATLSGCLFRGCVLISTDFSSATMRRTMFVGNSMPNLCARDALFIECYLAACQAPFVSFAGAKFAGAGISLCEFEGCDFQRAMLLETNLSKSHIVKCNFGQATLSGCVGTGLALEGNEMLKCNAAGNTFAADCSFKPNDSEEKLAYDMLMLGNEDMSSKHNARKKLPVEPFPL